VAILSPPPEGNPLERLRALGDVESAKGNLDDLPEPLVLAPRIERPSAVLLRLRKHER
jgi:hypothetical protein